MMQTQSPTRNAVTNNNDLGIDSDTPVIIVYYTEHFTWRGFMYPYDITTEVNTKSGALQAVKDMAAIYEEMLDECGRPEHLANKELSHKWDVQFRDLYINNKAQGLASYAERYIR
jgi:hypothetical protein